MVEVAPSGGGARLAEGHASAGTDDKTVAWGWVVAGLVLFHVAYLAVIWMALQLWGNLDGSMFFRVNQRWPRDGCPVFASHFATWDAAHYLALSEVGYERGSPSCAFYPLWPLAVRAGAVFTHGNHLLAGLLLANACSIGALTIFYRMAAQRFGGIAARWSLVWLAAFPGALFFHFIYSESLFLLLCLLLWRALAHDRWGPAFRFAFCLPLTRAVGVFCLGPILYAVVKRHWLATRQGEAVRPRLGSGWLRSEPGWVLVGPLAGWLFYLALMWIWTGHPFEGFDAQKHWGRVHSLSNLVNWPKFVWALFHPSAWHEFGGSLLDRCVFAMLLFCLPGLWRIDQGLCLWAIFLGVVPAMSGTFTSFTRFGCVVFPMFLALGIALIRPRWRSWRWLLLGFFLSLQAVLVWRFVNFRWAG
ncbi:MAG: hypothetical protein U1G07_23630 [Verrucomicrobiota bacterium]